MGYYNHHAVIVIGWNEKQVSAARRRAKKIGLGVSSIVKTEFGDSSFLIGPDGSKEGWDDSDRGDERREEFRDYMATLCEDGCCPLRWCEVELPEDRYARVITDDKVRTG